MSNVAADQSVAVPVHWTMAPEEEAVEQSETATAVEAGVLAMVAVFEHADSGHHICWTQAPVAVATWTWVDRVHAEARAVAAMGGGELVAADQHTATACQQSPPVLVHAQHQEAEEEAGLHMPGGQRQAPPLLAALKTAQMDPPAAAVTDLFAGMDPETAHQHLPNPWAVIQQAYALHGNDHAVSKMKQCSIIRGTFAEVPMLQQQIGLAIV